MTDPGLLGEDADSLDGVESFDRIVADLCALRESAGPVSYAELVRRITVIRLQRGVREAAAAPARSTVYNAFQSGRSRLDAELIRDIVLALGVDAAEAHAWTVRCRAAGRAASRAAVHIEAAPGRPDMREGQNPPRAVRAAPPAPAPAVTAALLAACVALNLVGLYITGVFKLSVYLDMVGTAIAAIALGPWYGAAVGIASSGLGIVTGDPATIPFTPVNVVGALVWGYGVRRFGMGANLSRYVSLNLIVAFACSLVAAPIVAMLFHGGDGHASEQAVLSLEALRIPFAAAVFSANVVTSVMDKLLTGFIALVVCALLHRRSVEPDGSMPLLERLSALRVSGIPRPGMRRALSGG